MCVMMDHKDLSLTEQDKELVHKNTRIERINDCSDAQFIRTLEGFLQEGEFDLLIINPLSSYTDPADTEKLSAFLRQGLNRLMEKFNFGVLLIHHTPKTNFKQEKSLEWYDWQYIGGGIAALTNWARAILVVWPTDV